MHQDFAILPVILYQLGNNRLMKRTTAKLEHYDFTNLRVIYFMV